MYVKCITDFMQKASNLYDVSFRRGRFRNWRRIF